MTPVDHLWTNAAAVAVLMTVVWLISVFVRNASIIDIAWGPGFAVIAWTSFALDDSTGVSRWLLPVLATAWGLRLGIYLACRNLGKPEDFRYQAMRDHHGPAFAWKSWYRVFQLQAVIMGVVSGWCVSAVATGKESPSMLGILVISLPLFWYGGKASWYLIVNYPKTIQWCRESNKLEEPVAELHTKIHQDMSG